MKIVYLGKKHLGCVEFIKNRSSNIISQHEVIHHLPGSQKMHPRQLDLLMVVFAPVQDLVG